MKLIFGGERGNECNHVMFIVGLFGSHPKKRICNHEFCVVIVVVCGQSPRKRFNRRNLTSCIHMHICPQYMHIKYLVNNAYTFKNSSHFLIFLHPPLLPVQFIIAPSYLVQRCICRRPSTQKNQITMTSIFLFMNIFQFVI